MDMAEFDYNMAQGEFTTASEDKTITLVHDGQSFEVSAVVSRKYARKEVDGRFTTDLPTFTLTVIIAESQVPPEIPVSELRYLEVIVDGVTYAVRFITGTGLLALTLKPVGGESGDEVIEEEEIV